MSFVHKDTVTVVTDASGAAVAYTNRTLTGKISSLHYLKDGTTPFADGVDFTITVESTGESLWTESNVNASATRRPRAPTHDGVGAASLYAAAGEPVEDKIAIAEDRVKISIAQGGDTKTGTFVVTME